MLSLLDSASQLTTNANITVNLFKHVQGWSAKVVPKDARELL